MRFEVGKKYKVRGKDIKYIRVDAIRLEFSDCAAMPITIFWEGGGAFHDELCPNGKRHEDGSDSDCDIIGPYEEPALIITAKDVGRKVRHRNGTVSLILHFCGAPPYPVGLLGDYFSESGSAGRNQGQDETDIIEFVD